MNSEVYAAITNTQTARTYTLFAHSIEDMYDKKCILDSQEELYAPVHPL